MKKLREKFHSNKGFTLIEMLMVVAIIAILIAVSIPVVGQALESAREATDAANERSFKAELMICYLSGTVDGTHDFETSTSGYNYVYDAQNGKIVPYPLATGVTITPYGQGTSSGEEPDHEDQILQGLVRVDGSVAMRWINP